MNGLLGTRGSLMLDLVVLAMLLAIPALFVSIALVRRKRYLAHKRIQLTIASILGVALLAFEIEMRVCGWRHRAIASPLHVEGLWNDSIEYVLLSHLLCAVPTFVLWVFVIYRALRRFPVPISPSDHSASHRFWGRMAAIGMILTSVTGWVFYYLAFVMTA